MSGIEVTVILQAMIILLFWFHAGALSDELKREREEQNKLWNQNKKLANDNDELRYNLHRMNNEKEYKYYTEKENRL